jgi:hypothetical protein
MLAQKNKTNKQVHFDENLTLERKISHNDDLFDPDENSPYQNIREERVANSITPEERDNAYAEVNEEKFANEEERHNYLKRRDKLRQDRRGIIKNINKQLETERNEMDRLKREEIKLKKEEEENKSILTRFKSLFKRGGGGTRGVVGKRKKQTKSYRKPKKRRSHKRK